MPFSGPSLTPRHLAVYTELQAEAARYPGAEQLPTPFGPIWMTPIEADLYRALLRAGLRPVPQFCIQGFFVDFAFPGVRIAVEADGAVHQDPTTSHRDHWRDAILRRAGWIVLRFHGTTIVHRADNCAYVVQQAVAEHERNLAEIFRKERARQEARAEAWRH
ncbi:MAG TPA: DUF559 domain-containing protein, partial [Thermoplasmata archaeon]|nr:DUF559 domain-containing protein [Thermoplasmata archaeon]